MLKKSITFDNPFTNEPVTEEHYFHISKADLVEMEMEEHNNTYGHGDEILTGMRAKLQRIVDSNDGKAIMAEFKDIILRAYGKKDGDRFLKSKAIRDDFAATEAFSQLLFELCTQPDAAAEFVKNVVPHNLDKIAEEVKERAEIISRGREAQELAKTSTASGKAIATPPEGHPSDPAATSVETTLSNTAEPNLAERIDAATAENPVELTEADVRAVDSDTLKSALATGRVKMIS